ncbi:MAG: hypothetical protein HY308_09240 [Gammaproteobacteria bacterium]|nr:hypothetical protein [Gammaproteobacteria bacterium]
MRIHEVNKSHLKSAVLAVGVTLLLVACGGGGDGDSGSTSSGGDDVASGPSNTVTLEVRVPQSSINVLFSYQIGSGSWQTKAPVIASDATTHVDTYTYTFTVGASDDRYGIMAVCASSTGSVGELFQATTRELTRRSVNCSDKRTFNGTVKANNVSYPTFVGLDLFGVTSLSADHHSYTFDAIGLIPGRHVLAATNWSSGFSSAPTVYINRNVTIDGATVSLPEIDFATGAVANGGIYTVTATGAPAFMMNTGGGVRLGATPQVLSIGNAAVNTGSASNVYYALDSRQLQADDRYNQVAAQWDQTGSDVRQGFNYSKAPRGYDFTFPAAVAPPIMGAPDSTLQFSFSPYSPGGADQVATSYRFIMANLDASVNSSFTVYLTRGWLGPVDPHTNVHVYSFPDFAWLTGWNSSRFTPRNPKSTDVYGVHYRDFFEADSAATVVNPFDLVEGFNNGDTPITEGAWSVASRSGPF